MDRVNSLQYCTRLHLPRNIDRDSEPHAQSHRQPLAGNCLTRKKRNPAGTVVETDRAWLRCVCPLPIHHVRDRMCTQYLLDYIYTFHVWSSPVLTWPTHHANKNCCTLCYSFYTSITKLTLSYIRLTYHN